MAAGIVLAFIPEFEHAFHAAGRLASSDNKRKDLSI
jgi:hypothetical protein